MNLAELTKLYDFTNRTVVITGGTGVLCGAMAKALAGCGANLAILARSADKGAALVESIKGSGRAIIVPGNVLEKPTLEEAAEAVLAEFGRIDCLINGAGGNSPQATTTPGQSFFDLPEEALRY